MIFKKTSLFTGLLIASFSLSSSPVPDEFKNLFEVKSREVTAVGIDGTEITILIYAGYDYIQIKDKASLESYKFFLERNGIEKSQVDKIISELSYGRKNKPVCSGLIERCVHIPEKYDIYFDYYTNKIYFYANPNILVKNINFNDEIIYVDPLKENWSFINHIDAYANVSKDNENSFSLYNSSVLGLPYGNVVSDIYYQNGTNDIKLNELNYNLEVENYRYVLGLTRYGANTNSTSFLNSKNNNKEIGLTVSTSKNLISGPKNQTQKLFFFAPNEGVLTVYRDDRIILQKNVSAGQGYITNDELPKGRYEAIFVISSGGSEISKEVKRVYNTNSDVLAVGSYDTSFTMGMFDGYTSTQQDDHDFSGNGFFRSMLSYRPFEPLVVGASSVFTKTDSAFTLGANAYLPMNARLTLIGEYFINDAYYYDMSLNLMGWDLSYQKFSGSEEADFARYFYGRNNFSRATIGKGFGLPYSILGYMNYSYYSNDNISSEKSNKFESSLLGLGLSTYILNGTSLQLNLDYDFKQSNSDSFTAQLAVSIPFNNDYSVRSRMDTRGDELRSLRTTVKKENLFSNTNNIQGDLTIGHNYYPDNHDEHTYDMSVNTTLTHDAYKLTSYVYTNSNNNLSGIGSFSSSQNITKNGFAATKNKSNSYLIIDSQNKIDSEHWKEQTKGLLLVEENGKARTKRFIERNKEVVPLRDYQKYRSFIDSDTVGLRNSGEKFAESYSLPGTVKYIKTDMARVLSFISGFRDIFDNEILDINCKGDACLSNEMITYGIYKVSVKEGVGFHLGNEQLVCFIPPVEKSTMLNFGYNYCVPKLEPMEQYVSRNEDQSITLTFVGGFNKKDYSQFIKKQIESVIAKNEDVIEKEIGEVVYVYVNNQHTAMSNNNVELLYNIQRFAKDNELLNGESIFTLVNL